MRKPINVVSSILLAGIISSAHAEGFMPWSDIMKMADANNDQVLTPKEVMTFEFATQYPGFQPFVASHFMQLDADHDGTITFEEFRSRMTTIDMDDKEMDEAFSVGIGFMPWDNRS